MQRPRNIPAGGRHTEAAGGHGGAKLFEAAAREWTLTIERFPERDAEAEQVRPLVGDLAAELLGRHIGRRSDEGAAGGQRDRRLDHRRGGRGRRGLPDGHGRLERRQLRQPEVGDAHAPIVADEHVVGLEVTVDDARRVCSHQPAARRAHDVGDGPPVARCLVQPAPEGRTVDQLHGDEELFVGGADLVDGDDVGMCQACHGARFARQPGAAVVDLLGELVVPARTQDLDRDLATQVGILGRIDPAHAARTDFAEHAIAPDARGVRRRGLGGRWRTHRLGHELPARRAAIQVKLGLLELESRQAP